MNQPNGDNSNLAEGQPAASAGGSSARRSAMDGVIWFLRCLRGRPFLAALCLVLLTGGAVMWIGDASKLPVPWPEGVQVDSGYRLSTLSKAMGPYVLIQKGGEQVIKEDDRTTLGIGILHDADRYPNRMSNWYVAQIYEDTRVKNTNSPYRFWRLEVYYYTGMDSPTVPHVPETCLQAGGARILDQSHKMTADVKFVGASRANEWKKPIDFQTTLFLANDPRGAKMQGITYHVFSINGVPTTDRDLVRLKLAVPLPKHAYFAKIQFTPIGGVTDINEADELARDFVGYMLPSVLSQLPMEAEIEALRTP